MEGLQTTSNPQTTQANKRQYGEDGENSGDDTMVPSTSKQPRVSPSVYSGGVLHGAGDCPGDRKQTGVMGFSKETTLALLPRMYMEELLSELDRRNIVVKLSGGNRPRGRDDLEVVLKEVMMKEYEEWEGVSDADEDMSDALSSFEQEEVQAIRTGWSQTEICVAKSPTVLDNVIVRTEHPGTGLQTSSASGQKTESSMKEQPEQKLPHRGDVSSETGRSLSGQSSQEVKKARVSIEGMKSTSSSTGCSMIVPLTKKRRTWDGDKIAEILQDIVENNLTTSQAERKYGVPRSTIRDKLNGKSAVDARTGRPCIISQEEEDKIIFYTKYRTEHGFPISKKTILACALAVHLKHCQQNSLVPKVDPQKGLSNNWWKGFRSRNAKVVRNLDHMDGARQDSADKEAVKDFYELLTATLTKEGLSGQPHRLYNADERGFDLDPNRGKVLTFAKMHSPTSCMRKNISDHKISSLECIAADGSCLPPLITFSESYPDPSTASSLESPNNGLYAEMPSGFIETDVFLQWLDKCFVRFCSPVRPVLLLLDHHTTQVTNKVIDFAVKNEIILMGVPSERLHSLQPLDAPGSPFDRMKSKFKDVMQNFLSSITKSSFCKIYDKVRESSLTVTVVKTVFKKTGVYPVDERQMSEIWLSSNGASSSDEMTDRHHEEVKEDPQLALLPEEQEMIALAEEVEVGSSARQQKAIPDNIRWNFTGNESNVS